MENLFPLYDLNAATWLYLSLLLIIAVFFRFSRVWSLRNLDLTLLLLLSPGLLLVEHRPTLGYTCLFVVTGLLLLRLFCDPLFQRRPRLDQNLNAAGLAFLCVASFSFLTAAALARPVPSSMVETVRRGGQLLNREDASAGGTRAEAGPTSSLLAAQVVPLSNAVANSQDIAGPPDSRRAEIIAARIMAVVSHLAVVVGLVLIGWRLFGEAQIGLAMGTLYLLLPCTAEKVSEVNHVLPSALILWAFIAYRRPAISGGLMGLACGTLYFPVFLLPLWFTFYGRRGATRFGAALASVGLLLLGSLALVSADPASFVRQAQGMIDWSAVNFSSDGSTSGFWSPGNSPYRLPVLVAYVIMVVLLTVWPRRKNLEHLMAHSAAIVVGTQFWYPQQGGVYLLWYLPLILMVVFRPRLVQFTPPTFTRASVEQKPIEEPPRRELIGSGMGSRSLFR